MHVKIIQPFQLLFSLSLVLMAISCTSQEELPIDIPDPEPQKEEINYLALGDSYTIGQGVEEHQRWPNQLIEKLKSNNYLVDKTGIIAKTGWTTRNLLDAIEENDVENYNLVSLLIGVNNQYQNQPFTMFTSDFDLLLSKSIEIAGGSSRVFVVSIPDYGVTPFGSSNSEKIGMEIDMYNQYILDHCNAKNIPFIDITEISRTLGATNDALAPDNLHPSGTQYAVWVDSILPIVIELLDH